MAKAAFLFRDLSRDEATFTVRPPAVAGFDVDKLVDAQPRHRLRVAAGAVSLDIDLGAALPVDVAALVSTTLIEDTQVTLRGSSSAVGSNYLLRSNEFEQSPWSAAHGSINLTNEGDPDSGTTARHFAENTDNDDHVVSQTITGLASSAYVTISAHLKQKERTWARIEWFDKTVAKAWANVNLATGAIGLTSGSIFGVVATAAGNGFYRLSALVPTRTGAANCILLIHAMTGDNSVSTYIGTAGSGIIIARAQVDYGWLSAYVATTTAAVEPSASTGVQSNVTSADYNGNVIAVLAAPQTLRYWRWDIFQNSANNVDIGLAPIGQLFRPGRNYQYGAQEGLIDLSLRTLNEDTGGAFAVAGPKLRTKLLQFNGLTTAETRDTLASMDRLVGASGDVLFVDDPDAAWINRARDSIWGSYRAVGSDSFAARVAAQNWARPFRMVERL